MKCKDCGKEIDLCETYKRGRRERNVVYCIDCKTFTTQKGRLIPYNKRISAVKPKGCTIPWGKSKKSRINPKKKKGSKR